MKFYNMKVNEVLSNLKSDLAGLTLEEAKKRLLAEGHNKLVEQEKESKIQKFFQEFRNLMIIILIFAAILSFLFSIIRNESIMDSVIILLIVFLNALLGFIQELKADRSIEALKKLQVSRVKVKREHQVLVINSEDVVRGDIILLEAGDAIVADARILSSSSLRVDESSLTGESNEVFKNSEVITEECLLANRRNMIYSGTHVVYGKCEAVVCEIGMNTEFGKIANSLNDEVKEETPLQKKINEISKFLSIIIAFIILVMFIIGFAMGIELIEVLMLSISLAVAAIPEGLPAVITITLSLGMNVMAKKKAIIRKMSSVETLGCTEIICSDKTGTITQNKMMVREFFYNNKICVLHELDEENLLFRMMCLNNDALKEKNGYLGDPTEIALYECLEHVVDISKIRTEIPRINELPFDSERKMMSTVHLINGKYYLYVKGSFDTIIHRCNSILEDDNVKKLTEKKKSFLKSMESQESEKSYRVLSFAYRELEEHYVLDDTIENNLIFVGMTAMMDPPREDVKEAIAICKNAHIRPIMITGDSFSTAVSIAREVGILENEAEAITGEEIDHMSESELDKNIFNYSVYARVSPMNKLSIVNAWKRQGKIVAMTGDGVNDAPALKASDIGIGMGLTGTEVTKGVADVILADDSFSTIVVAVMEGRRIYDNIRNVLIYLLTGNLAEVFVVFVGMLFGMEIFLPIQLLYINLITDSIPAIALAFENGSKDIMSRDVRKSSQPFFTPFLIAKMAFSSVLKTSVILFVYFLNLKSNGSEVAITMAFLTLILSEMIYAFSCKDLKRKVLGKKLVMNQFMNYSMLILGIIQILLFVTPLKHIFHIINLNAIQVCLCTLLVLVIFFIDEFTKPILRRLFKD